MSDMRTLFTKFTLVAALLTLLVPLGVAGEHVEVEVLNVTPDTTFSDVIGFSHPNRTDGLDFEQPSQALIDASSQLPAKPLVELLEARDSTAGLVHRTKPLSPGDAVTVYIPTRTIYSEGFTVLMLFENEDGFGWYQGSVKRFAPIQRPQATALQAGPRLSAHQSVRSPVALLQVDRLTETESRRRKLPCDYYDQNSPVFNGPSSGGDKYWYCPE